MVGYVWTPSNDIGNGRPAKGRRCEWRRSDRGLSDAAVRVQLLSRATARAASRLAQVRCGDDRASSSPAAGVLPRDERLRLWLSWDCVHPRPGAVRLAVRDAALDRRSHGMRVMPLLFNRWHDSGTDWGGIYIDHFLPGASWVQKDDMWARTSRRSSERMQTTRASWRGTSATSRSRTRARRRLPAVDRRDRVDLARDVHALVKATGATAPIGVSAHPNRRSRSSAVSSRSVMSCSSTPTPTRVGCSTTTRRSRAETGKPLLSDRGLLGRERRRRPGRDHPRIAVPAEAIAASAGSRTSSITAWSPTLIDPSSGRSTAPGSTSSRPTDHSGRAMRSFNEY